MLDETQDRLCAGNTTDFSDLKAMIVNCTLKRGDTNLLFNAIATHHPRQLSWQSLVCKRYA